MYHIFPFFGQISQRICGSHSRTLGNSEKSSLLAQKSKRVFFLFDFQKNFFSPAIVLFSILTFSLFRSLSISTDLTKLSTLTFYIYLFHTLVYKILFSLSFLNVENELLMILIVSILTFLISLIISMVFVRLLELIEKKFDLKNKWYSCKIWSW